jgi:hypothetical protein
VSSYFLNLILFSGIALMLVFWWKTQGVKQMAFRLVRRRCDELGIQLLDQSIVLRGISLKRGPTGRVELLRRFAFEFSSTGNERYHGEVHMLGRRAEHIEFEPHRL